MTVRRRRAGELAGDVQDALAQALGLGKASSPSRQNALEFGLI